MEEPGYSVGWRSIYQDCSVSPAPFVPFLLNTDETTALTLLDKRFNISDTQVKMKLSTTAAVLSLLIPVVTASHHHICAASHTERYDIEDCNKWTDHVAICAYGDPKIEVLICDVHYWFQNEWRFNNWVLGKPKRTVPGSEKSTGAGDDTFACVYK
ncbi:unnamed protein product [Zymoseptoria tritici ST99CH_1A5]|uniref:Uncharacterized protein n=1 Tax=Zymoseptoria tritici ST99CH_1A5 TaxID=1276529 RepID=A0A1Y6L4K0_ZYMTR|nr:unnamed protein product [Zymoseptoria tritici ST99CH_1A5]